MSGAEALYFLKPCDPIVKKNVSGFIDLPGITDRSPFAQASALLVRGPEGPNEADCVSVK
jgi:hypothetical protein